jgi:hypothetical protein
MGTRLFEGALGHGHNGNPVRPLRISVTSDSATLCYKARLGAGNSQHANNREATRENFTQNLRTPIAREKPDDFGVGVEADRRTKRTRRSMGK